MHTGPLALLLLSVVQVEEVCDRSRVVPQILHCKLRQMALTVEQMLYGVWCHSTVWTNIWYAAGDAGLVTVQKPTVTRTQLSVSGTDWLIIIVWSSVLQYLWIMSVLLLIHKITHNFWFSKILYVTYRFTQPGNGNKGDEKLNKSKIELNKIILEP